ncbi:MAG TPA: flagellar filament capping protein FliD [Burkholderiaceae bacterium]|nr:flagellar filament capping protein FliD [Burkholderiaceae bacterium]
MAVNSTGLDVAGIVSQLMTIERRPLTKLATKEAGIQGKLSAIGALKGALAAVQTAAQRLEKVATFNARTAGVVGDQVSASATDAAVEGAYSVTVTQLARAQSLASRAFSGAAAVVGGGTLTLQKGTYESGANTFTPASGVAAVEITLEAGATLATIRDRINAANADVSAALVTDVNGTRLTLTSKSTGAANSFKITVDDLDGNDTDNDANETDDNDGLSMLAFDPTAAASSGKNLTETRSAVNAIVSINGLTVTSASNTVTDAIQGVTLTLKKEDALNAAQVTVNINKAAMHDAVNAFVKAYNELEKHLATAMAYDPATHRAGPLNGDATARNVQAQLRALIGASQKNQTAYTTLSSIGVSFEKDGSLKFDSTKFDTAFTADAARVTKLFTLASADTGAAGIAVQIEDLMTSMLGDAGPIKARTEGLNGSLQALGKQQEAINRRLEQTEVRLRRTYSRLDSMLAAMQTTSNSLANSLAQLPGANNKG